MSVSRQKPSQTVWERYELASLDPPKPVVVATPVEEPAEPLPQLPSEEEIAQIREEARLAGEETGYTAGYAAGLSAGHGEGMAAGHAEGAAKGYAEGHEAGLAAGQEAGYEAGRAKGMEIAVAQGEKEAAALAQVLANLESRIAELNPAVADELLALSVEIARQVVRQTVALQPETILTVIREALLQLPLVHATIHLHPEDASLARLRAGDQLSHAGHRIHEDAKLKRGDVTIEAGSSHIDASLASRWRRALEALGQHEPWIDCDKNP